MNLALLYARVSSKEQDKEGYSIPAQLRLLKDYARKNDLKIVREFIDVETAKQAGRANFGEMIRFLQGNAEVKTVLVEKTDRLYRNFRDYVTIDDLDLEIHLVKEGEILSRDSKSHQKFIHGIKVLMAKNYIDNLAEETRKGMLEKAQQGIYPSTAPRGYINDPQTKTIQVDRERAPLISRMFELYATGNYSLSQLTDLINQEGLRTRGGKRLGKSAVESVLKNPIYYGWFRWRGRLYKGIHEPIVTKELFDAVQMAFGNHNKPKYTKQRLPFAGFLKCGICGCSITGEKQKGRYVYYRCSGYHGKCGNTYVRQEELEEKFGEIVKKIRIDEDVLVLVKDALKESHKDEKDFHDQQIERFNREYSALQNRIDRMYVDKLDGRISEAFYEEHLDQWRADQENLLERIKVHQNANVDYCEKGLSILELANKAYFLYLQQTAEEKRKLLNFVLLNCTLTKGTLCPTYRKPFDILAKGLTRSNWRPQPDLNRCRRRERAVS